MKKLTLIVLATSALAGCKQQTAPAPAPSETTPTATAAGLQSANGSLAGAFAVTAKNGTVTTTALNADGTYTDSDARGKVTAQGTWAVKDGKTCFTATKGSDSGCYTESAPGSDGSFTATPDKGDPVTVKPISLSAADIVGTYDLIEDGKPQTTVAKADGTFQDSIDGKVVESGTWMVKRGEICFDNKAEPVRCWTTTKPDAKGKFNSISTDGKMTAQGTKRPA